MAKLRRVVIKEELVALTGDYKKAIVLNQMIYWSQRVQDRSQLIEEEKRRLDCEKDLRNLISHGWIYKKAEELSKETLMDIGPKAMREHLKYLVSKGWLYERRNPQDKMDRTLQYRVNLVRIQKDLRMKGYTLEGYTLESSHSRNIQEENTRFHYEKSMDLKENRKGREELVAKVEIEAPKVKKEKTLAFESTAAQGIQDTNLPTKITTEIINTKITKQQQEVAVVQDRIIQLFNKKLSKKNVESLIYLAKKDHLDLDKMIDNTYAYHTKVKKCRNLFGAIKYALDHGGWEIHEQTRSLCMSQRAQSTYRGLPKAVQRQIESRYQPITDEFDPVYLAKKARIQEKLKELAANARC